MYLICGLGNPGSEYELTRHNIGWLVLDQWRGSLLFNYKKKFKGELLEVDIAGQECLLLKPMTYMNLSGESLWPIASFYQIKADQVIVIHDDVDLSLGSVRIKKGGGHGGHNGLRSIVSTPIGDSFLRIRVGVGRPGDFLHPHLKMETADYVLGKWGRDEGEILERVILGAKESVIRLLQVGISKAQTEIHSIDYSKL